MSELIYAMKTLLNYYEKSLKNDYVKKKISWSLYETWKYFDSIEGSKANE